MITLRPLGRCLAPTYRQSISPLCRRYADKTSPSIQPAPKSDPSEAPSAKPGDSAMIREEDAAEGMVSHQPDYHAPTDSATS